MSIPMNAINRALPEDSPDRYTAPVTSMLVDMGNGEYLLYDTGMSAQTYGPNGRVALWRQRKFPFASPGTTGDYTPEKALSELGICQREVRYVVLSHMHWDPAGCVDCFPNAEFYAGENEIIDVLKESVERVSSRFTWASTDAWIRNRSQWHLIGDGVETLNIAPDIQICNFGPGHSSAMLGMKLTLPETGVVLAVEDCCYTEEAYRNGWLPGAVYDLDGWRSTISRIRGIEQNEKALVVFGHDPDQFRRLYQDGKHWLT